MPNFPKKTNNNLLKKCFIYFILLISSSSLTTCLIEIPLKTVKVKNRIQKYQNIIPKLKPTKEVFNNFSNYLKIFSESGEYKINNETLFLAPITIGSNSQSFNLILDTGSDVLWVAQTNSKDTGIIKRHYNSSSSSTSTKTEESFYMIYGTFSCSGYYYKDIVSYINNSPFEMKFGVASNTNFNSNDADGILGLSKYYEENEKSLIMNLYKNNITNSKKFSFKFYKEDKIEKGTFYIGEHEDFTKNETTFCSLLNSTEYEKTKWSCKMNSMSLVNNNISINANGNYSVIFDTGSNFMILPLSYGEEIINDVSKFGCNLFNLGDNVTKSYHLQCGSILPDLQFKIDNNIYKIPHEFCYFEYEGYNYSRVIFIQFQMYIIGSPFFFTYHTLFDNDNGKLYFYSQNVDNLKNGSGISTKTFVIIIVSIVFAVGLICLIVCLIKWKLKGKNQEILDIPSNDYLISNN